MAANEDADLIIAYVHEAPWTETLACRLFGDADSQQQHERENIIRSRLAEVSKPWLEGVPGKRVSYHVELDDEHRARIGDLGDELLADLIVIGVRPQGLLGDLLSISTCQRAVEDSLCSVLAVTSLAVDTSPAAS